MPQLTRRQAEIVKFIERFYERRGTGPTLRDIGEAFGIRSTNGVMAHIWALEKKGAIHRRNDRTSRGILPAQRVIKTDCPHCGEPIEVIEKFED